MLRSVSLINSKEKRRERRRVSRVKKKSGKVIWRTCRRSSKSVILNINQEKKNQNMQKKKKKNNLKENLKGHFRLDLLQLLILLRKMMRIRRLSYLHKAKRVWLNKRKKVSNSFRLLNQSLEILLIWSIKKKKSKKTNPHHQTSKTKLMMQFQKNHKRNQSRKSLKNLIMWSKLKHKQLMFHQ